jgi:P2 family phage major capsid protein
MNQLSARSKANFSVMLGLLASSYGVTSVAETFSATPEEHQMLMDKIVLQSTFLQQINVLPVTEIVGQKILGSASGLVTTRTNTTGSAERAGRHLLELDTLGYQLHQTDMDTALLYSLIDSWAKFPDLATRYANYINKAIATNKAMIGWHGTSVAATTNPTTNPLGQDVNKGWLQILREQAAAQVMTEGDTADKVILGASGDYENLNAMVYGALSLLPEVHADSPDLVAIVGRDLIMRDKGKRFAQHGELPSEKQRIEMAQTIDTYGGLPAYTVPYFPARGVLVTSFENLSLYYQESSIRRQIVDEPKKNQYVDYRSQNEGYVVETLEKAGYIESANVEFAEEQA